MLRIFIILEEEERVFLSQDQRDQFIQSLNVDFLMEEMDQPSRASVFEYFLTILIR